MRILVDKAVWQQLVEPVDAEIGELAHEVFRFLIISSTKITVPSLTFLQLYANRTIEIIKKYSLLFDGLGNIKLQPLSSNLVERAATIAEDTGVSLEDAIYLVSAIDTRCSHFIVGTDKNKFDRKFKDVRIITIEEFYNTICKERFNEYTSNY